MEKIRCEKLDWPKRSAGTSRASGLDSHAPRFQGRIQLPGIERRLVAGNMQVIAPASLPNYEAEIKHLSPGCSVTVEGEIKPSPAQGQATGTLGRA
jgi:hypothetical protein